jgi:hypothetical protein
MKDKITAVKNELEQEFHKKTDVYHVVKILDEKLAIAAQAKIDEANSTGSYDEKITKLVEAVQEMLSIVAAEHNALLQEKTRYEHQKEIIDALLEKADAKD